MHTARIAELLEPYLGSPDDRRPTTDDLEHISTYIDLLRHWNARINLTAIRNEEEIVTRHFGESLFAARHLFPDASTIGNTTDSAGRTAALQGRISDKKKGGAAAPESANDQGPTTDNPNLPRRELRTTSHCPPTTAHSLADLGSGAGFPGIPIKLWAPHIHLTLIESNQKKTAFLREVVRALTLTNVDIQNSRAETIAGTYDVVTLRAVERFEDVLPIAARLVEPGGRLALLIGSSQEAAAILSLDSFAPAPQQPIPNSESRVLLITTNQSSNYVGKRTKYLDSLTDKFQK